MTVSLMVPRSATMPGYNNNNNIDLDEVQSIPSDFSYTQTTMIPSTNGLLSFSQTEPLTDLLNSTSWATTVEGSQNFQDFPDSGPSPTGENEEYIYSSSGQTTPKGSRLDRCQVPENPWVVARTSSTSAGSQSMSRGTSNKSTGSLLSQTANMRNVDVRGNAASFQIEPQTAGPLGMDPCLILDAEAHSSSSMFWNNCPVDLGLDQDPTGYSMTSNLSPLHIVPSQMQLGGDISLGDNSTPGSWDCFSSSISRTSSPATVDDAFFSGPLSPNSSPEIPGQSPAKYPGSVDDVTHGLHQLDDALSLPPSFGSRRSVGEGESARDHALYKHATPQADGLYHCPWEGQASCTHKAEKLKCNYDKFVDSHLKPYRCKAETCEGNRFSSTACLLRHEREAHGLHGHGDKPFLCVYDGCERAVSGNGFPRQWNLRDHMKRVHNDYASISGSPPTVTIQPATKGRKRKTDGADNQTATAATTRKTAVKTAPAPETKPSAIPLLDQWMNHRKAVEELLNGLEKPEDARNLHQIGEVQKRLSAMAKMTTDLTSVPDPESLPVTRRHSYRTTI